MKYQVKYYYLATGMEGHADEQDYGVYEAKSEKDAIKKAIEKHHAKDPKSTQDWVRGCLSAKKLTTAEEDKADALRYRHWRDGDGICIGDAPVQYLSGKELDDYTDEAMRKS